MKITAKLKAQSEEEEAKSQDIHTEENKPNLGDDNLRTTKLTKITHPPPNGPRFIEDDALNFRSTRSSKCAALLATVEISGSCPSPQQAAGRRYTLTFMCDFAGSVLDTETGELLEYRHPIKHPKFKDDWGYSFWNKIGRLAQGMPERNTGTNTIKFIHKSEMPADRWKDVAHTRIVCNVRPQKEEVNRTRLTFWGNNLSVPMDCGTPTADLLTAKLLLNSVISTPGAKFTTLDLKDF